MDFSVWKVTPHKFMKITLELVCQYFMFVSQVCPMTEWLQYKVRAAQKLSYAKSITEQPHGKMTSYDLETVYVCVLYVCACVCKCVHRLVCMQAIASAL